MKSPNLGYVLYGNNRWSLRSPQPDLSRAHKASRIGRRHTQQRHHTYFIHHGGAARHAALSTKRDTYGPFLRREPYGD